MKPKQFSHRGMQKRSGVAGAPFRGGHAQIQNFGFAGEGSRDEKPGNLAIVIALSLDHPGDFAALFQLFDGFPRPLGSLGRLA